MNIGRIRYLASVGFVFVIFFIFVVLTVFQLFQYSPEILAEFPFLYLLLIVLWFPAYLLVVSWLRGTIIAEVLFKLAAWFLLAFLASDFLQKVWPEGIVIPIQDAPIYLDEVLLVAFLTMKLFAILSLLRLSYLSPYLYSVGNWFNRFAILGFFVGLIISFYFQVRSYLLVELESLLIIGEWSVLGLLMLIVFIKFYRLSLSLAQEDSNSSSDLAQHIENIQVNKEEEFEEISSYINNFIENGESDYLISFVAMESVKAGLTLEDLRRIIGPVLNYRERRKPIMLIKQEAQMYEKADQDDRQELAKNLVDEFVKLSKVRGKRKDGSSRRRAKM